MKLFIPAMLSFLITSVASATGSVTCELSPGTLSTITVSAGTSHIVGYPILEELEIDGSGSRFGGVNETIPKARVVNYKNMEEELFIAAVDKKSENLVLLLRYNWNTNKGSAFVKVDDVEQEFRRIECVQE